MKFSIRKRMISLVLVFVMIMPYVITAMGTTSDDLDDAKDKQGDIKNKIEDTQKLIDDLKKSTTDISSYIETLDKKVDEINGQIDAMNVQITEKQTQISANEISLAKAKAASTEQYASMKLRIQYMYEHESDSYLETLLESKNMGEMLNKAEYINKITSYDREMLTQYAETVKSIETTEAALKSERTELETAKATIEEQKDSLKLVQNSKEAELKTLQSKSAAATAYAAQLDAAEKAQEAQIKAMEAEIARQEAAARAAANAGKGGAAMPNYDGGKFTWPVPASRRITSRFGDLEDRGGVSHNGVDIGAATSGVWGDNIVAAYDGVVVAAGYAGTAGYWIWINHGDGLYTVYMHNRSDLLVSVNDTVKKGQVISHMGSTGNSTGAHLHFGVRLNGVYVNPNKYLNY